MGQIVAVGCTSTGTQALQTVVQLSQPLVGESERHIPQLVWVWRIQGSLSHVECVIERLFIILLNLYYSWRHMLPMQGLCPVVTSSEQISHQFSDPVPLKCVVIFCGSEECPENVKIPLIHKMMFIERIKFGLWSGVFSFRPMNRLTNIEVIIGDEASDKLAEEEVVCLVDGPHTPECVVDCIHTEAKLSIWGGKKYLGWTPQRKDKNMKSFCVSTYRALQGIYTERGSSQPSTKTTAPTMPQGRGSPVVVVMGIAV